ncbi:hypothetical protein C8R43DRAFT_1127714 [Mycena crocata]|nr:hypothetical protein C8R43DRAFT_1127714 [Mycena crocata]
MRHRLNTSMNFQILRSRDQIGLLTSGTQKSNFNWSYLCTLLPRVDRLQPHTNSYYDSCSVACRFREGDSSLNEVLLLAQSWTCKSCNWNGGIIFEMPQFSLERYSSPRFKPIHSQNAETMHKELQAKAAGGQHTAPTCNAPCSTTGSSNCFFLSLEPPGSGGVVDCTAPRKVLKIQKNPPEAVERPVLLASHRVQPTTLGLISCVPWSRRAAAAMRILFCPASGMNFKKKLPEAKFQLRFQFIVASRQMMSCTRRSTSGVFIQIYRTKFIQSKLKAFNQQRAHARAPTIGIRDAVASRSE